MKSCDFKPKVDPKTIPQGRKRKRKRKPREIMKLVFYYSLDKIKSLFYTNVF